MTEQDIDAGTLPQSFRRKDAQERRERLIVAAVDLYASEGSHVALEKIAERAGVTRTTLYRNFPDRAAITAIVLEVYLSRFARRIAEWSDREDVFFLALKLMAHRAIRSGGTGKIMEFRRETGPLAKVFTTRVETILAGPLERAKKAGLISADFSVQDAHRAILMIASGSLGEPQEDIEMNEKVELSLDLLRSGIAPRL